MYFFYIDESGDCGEYDRAKHGETGSPYLIYSGIIVQDIRWKHSLDVLRNFRKRIAKDGFLNYDQEFHCAEMINPRKTSAYTQISVPERWKLIENYCKTICSELKCPVIAVVLNKANTLVKSENYMTEAITSLLRAFNHFLGQKQEHGIVFFDRANEKKISKHVRGLLGIGSTSQHPDLEKMSWILEDPNFKNSSDSMFIQTSDVVAYTFKQKEFPQAAKKKFNADQIFQKTLLANCYKSHVSDEKGIIRI